MILPFSTQLNKKPTFFVERIWAGLLELDYELYSDYLHPDGRPKQLKYASFYDDYKPKIHTIREDKNNRWQPGTVIDFFINVRQKNMFRFAPKLPVISTQKIEIKYLKGEPRIFIDGTIFYIHGFSRKQDVNMWHFANADGFDSVGEFFAYFNTDFSGKIIHWTDKRY